MSDEGCQCSVGGGVGEKFVVHSQAEESYRNPMSIRPCKYLSSGHDSAYLADIMKYRGNHFEVSDMESRQRQLDMPKVTIA